MDRKTCKEVKKYRVPSLPMTAYEWLDMGENDYKCHWHEACEFLLLTSGQMQVTVNGEDTTISEGEFIFIPSGAVHTLICADKTVCGCRVIEFDPVILAGSADDIVYRKYVQPIRKNKQMFRIGLPDSKAACIALNKLFEAVTAQSSVYELLCKAYLCELTAIVIDAGLCRESGCEAPPNKDLKCIQQVVSYINENYALSINVNQMSAMTNMSVGYFTREFKRYTGNSPIEYLIRVRLAKAAELLMQTDEKMINVAFETGFNNVSYFCRAFKAHFGCSPTDYRKKAPLSQFPTGDKGAPKAHILL